MYFFDMFVHILDCFPLKISRKSPNLISANLCILSEREEIMSEREEIMLEWERAIV